jgi:hypothetical protein
MWRDPQAAYEVDAQRLNLWGRIWNWLEQHLPDMTEDFLDEDEREGGESHDA